MPKLRGKDGKYKPITGLSNVQSKAIYMLVYEDYKYNKDVYEELGVPKSTYYHWFTQDLFTEELKKARDALFKEMSNKALKKLGQTLDSGDARSVLKACEMILKENGHLNDKIDITENTNKSITISIVNEQEEE
jgi:hypothetical protein